MIVKFLKNLPLAIAGTRALVHKYKTSRAFKAFETFSILKTFTDSGKIHKSSRSWDSFVSELAQACFLSRNTMYNRIEWLKDFELINIDNEGNILLESWADIAATYHVQDKEFYEIEVSESQPSFEYRLRVLVFAEIKNRLAFRFSQFINNNRVRDILESRLPFRWQSVQQIADYVVTCQMNTFKTGSENYDFWHTFRADFNINIETIKGYFSFDSVSTTSYLKSVLSKLKLIQVEERTIESKRTTRAAKNVLTGDTIPMYLGWDDKNKIRYWRMPDRITLISPCL